MNNSSAADEPVRMPKDAVVVQTMLQEMGITNYEPKLIPMVLDFMHQYTTDVLEEAKLFSIHAGRKQVELDDIKLACQNWADEHSTMPSKETLTELAKNKNRSALPDIRNLTGPRLPADRFCLLAPNYKLKETPNEHSARASTQHAGSSNAANASSGVTFTTDHYNPLTGTITTTTASGSFASNDLFSASNSTNNKRKMNESDDDDDDNYDM